MDDNKKSDNKNEYLDDNLMRQRPPRRPFGFPPGPPFGTPPGQQGPGRPPGQQRPGRPPEQPGTGRPSERPGLGSPPFGPPLGQQGPPSSAPPRFTPERQVSIFAVDPGSLRPCLYSFVYIWLDNRREFWFFPIFLGRRSVSGFRWNGFRWIYFGTDLRNIDSFVCF